MNGYEIMAASYRQMVKQGRIDKETADKEIRIYDASSMNSLRSR